MNLDLAKVKLRTYFEEACKVLNVNHETIDFAYEGIGERFKTNDVTCETAGNKLYINLKWLDTLPNNDNGDYDLQHQMYHEARHFYQHKAIADYHTRGKTTELPSTIKKWEFESSNYKPNEGTEEERKAYAAQVVEIDANAFAIAMLHSNGIDKARISEELMIETHKRALEIYSQLDRIGRWKNYKKVNKQ